ncbi:MAG: hypothetical protein EP306_10160 [Burkholderiales bacterium]|nr:MAG: hypothetical protein EP306_10160 [Burkholderiales bacterium]
MGIRLHNSTWRQPLVTLDCWPPMPKASPETSPTWWHRCIHGLAQACRSGLSRLGHRVSRDMQAWPPVQRVQAHGCARRGTPALRVTRRSSPLSDAPGNARLVISGRMSDVCAELDRLAALEEHQNKSRQ